MERGAQPPAFGHYVPCILWARIRAKAGHPEPFNLKMLAVGNENYGDYYINSFDKVYKAVKEKYPDFL